MRRTFVKHLGQRLPEDDLVGLGTHLQLPPDREHPLRQSFELGTRWQPVGRHRAGYNNALQWREGECLHGAREAAHAVDQLVDAAGDSRRHVGSRQQGRPHCCRRTPPDTQHADNPRHVCRQLAIPSGNKVERGSSVARLLSLVCVVETRSSLLLSAAAGDWTSHSVVR